MATLFEDDDAMDQDQEKEENEDAPSPQGGKDVASSEPVKPARAPRKRDPKLDLDLLEADGGFNDIWHKMAPTFKASFQGEGHEVADLRRLLELYQRWQTRFYPHCDFDSFVTKLEKAGRSRVVKAKMNSMRQNLLGLIFPADLGHEDAEADARVGEGAGAAAAGDAAQKQTAPGRPGAATAAATAAGDTQGAGAGFEDEDEELVAMQREAEWEAAYAAMDELEGHPAPPPPRQQHAPQPAQREGAGAAAVARATATETDVDMEELMALADELHYSGTATAPATAPEPRPSGGSPPGALSAGPAASAEAQAEAPSAAGPNVGTAQEALGSDAGGTAAAEAPAAGFDALDEELLELARDDFTAAAPPTQAAEAADGAGTDAGGAGGPAATQDAESAELDEDEELRLLAAMDTSDVMAAVASRQKPDAAVAGLSQGAVREGPMDVDSGGGREHEASVRQDGGTDVDLDAELLALANADTQVPLQVGDDADGSGGELYGSNGAELRAGTTQAGEVGGSAGDKVGGGAGVASLGSAAQGAGTAGAVRNDDDPGGELTQSVVPDSQGGLEAGMLVRGFLMTQTQQSQEEVE